MSTAQPDPLRLRNIADSVGFCGFEKEQVQKEVEKYNALFSTDGKKGEAEDEEIKKRKENYHWMVKHFYNLVTEFYEYGWGHSFHFAARHRFETFDAAIARQEFFLALRLGLKKDQAVLDLGCGIGGPARNIARFVKCNVTGVNNNDFQLKRFDALTQQQNLTARVKGVNADFMKLPFPDSSFDGAYQLEAFCHAPDKKGLYAEVFRVLKPGACFAGYEWCSTPKYNPNDKKQKDIIFSIEYGNGVPVVESFDVELAAIKAAGFELIEAYDRADDGELPWYHSLTANYSSFTGWTRTPLGRKASDWMVWGLEKCWLAPKGTAEVHHLLVRTADDLVAGGERGIFTPMYFTLIRKPLNAK
jgi:sterol 24-C-methyltransferase